MAKVKQPIKKFWESDKKPPYLGITKRKMKDDFTHTIRFIRQKRKKK